MARGNQPENHRDLRVAAEIREKELLERLEDPKISDELRQNYEEELVRVRARIFALITLGLLPPDDCTGRPLTCPHWGGPALQRCANCRRRYPGL